MKRPAPLVAVLLALGSGPVMAQIEAPDAGSKTPIPAYRPPPVTPYAAPMPMPTPAPLPPPFAGRPVLPPAPVPATGAIGGNDAGALQAERNLPLDPGTRNLQNQLPANPAAVERQLGLRVPVGPVTDLRGHTPSTQEIANGLNRH